MIFDASVATDPGWHFKQNQDAVLLDDQVWAARRSFGAFGKCQILVAVADGVAFSPCAAKASQTVLKLLSDTVKTTHGLPPSIARTIQRRITDKAAGTRCEGMASTLAAIRFIDDEAHVLSVGDSRVYLLREGRLSQITVDHTVARRMVNDGLLTVEEAGRAGSIYSDVDSTIVASDLEDRFDVCHEQRSCKTGDRWLCCTDGITAVLSDDEIADTLLRHPDQVLGSVAMLLIDNAKARRSSDDNLSVAIVAVR